MAGNEPTAPKYQYMSGTYSIVSDLTREAGVNEQFNYSGQLTFAQYDRAFWVEGIQYFNVSQDQWLGYAKAYLMANVPVGTAHPVNGYAKARYYRAEASPDSTTGCWVIVSFVFQADGYDTEWTIESDTFVEQVETDYQFNSDGSTKPIMVDNYYKDWKFGDAKPDPNKVSPESPAYGTCSVLRPRKRLVMTKTIYDPAAAQKLEQAASSYVGFVNSTTFRGMPQYSWLCMDVDVIAQPNKGINLGRIECIYRPETWYGWARYTNRNLGIPDNIWKADASGNTANANGIEKQNVYPMADFNALVNLVTQTSVNVFGGGSLIVSGGE